MALGYLLLPTVALAKRSISRARQPMFCKHSRQTRTKLCARRSYGEEFWIPATDTQRYDTPQHPSLGSVLRPRREAFYVQSLAIEHNFELPNLRGSGEERPRLRGVQTVRKCGETFETQNPDPQAQGSNSKGGQH